MRDASLGISQASIVDRDEKLKEQGTVTVFDGTEKSIIHCDTCSRDFNGAHSYDNHIPRHAGLDQAKVRVVPIKRLEELHPGGLTLEYGQPIPADVAMG